MIIVCLFPFLQTKNGKILLVSVYALLQSVTLQRSLFKDMYAGRNKTAFEMYIYVLSSHVISAGISVPPEMPMTPKQRKFYEVAFDEIVQTLGDPYRVNNPYRTISKRQVDDSDNRVDTPDSGVHVAQPLQDQLIPYGTPFPDNPTAAQTFANYFYQFLALIYNKALVLSNDLPKLSNIFVGVMIAGVTYYVFYPVMKVAMAMANYNEAFYELQTIEMKAARIDNERLLERAVLLDGNLTLVEDQLMNNTEKADEIGSQLEFLDNSVTAIEANKHLISKRPIIQKKTFFLGDIVISRIFDDDYSTSIKTEIRKNKVIHLSAFPKGILLGGNYNSTKRYVLKQSPDDLLLEVYLEFNDKETDKKHSCEYFFKDTTKRQKEYFKQGGEGDFLQFATWYDFKTIEFFRKKELSAFQRCACSCDQPHAFSKIKHLHRCVCLADTFYGLARFVTEVKGHIENFHFPEVLEPHADTHKSIYEMYNKYYNTDNDLSSDAKISLMAGISAALTQQYLSCDTADFDIACESEALKLWTTARLAGHKSVMSSSFAKVVRSDYFRMESADNTYIDSETPHKFDFRDMISELRDPPTHIPLVNRTQLDTHVANSAAP